MATDSTELTFVRCPSCRSLVPAVSTRCRMCGAGLDASGEGEEADKDQKKSGRVRQRTMSQAQSELNSAVSKLRASEGAAPVVEAPPVVVAPPPSAAPTPEPVRAAAPVAPAAPEVMEEEASEDPLSAYIEEVEESEPVKVADKQGADRNGHATPKPVSAAPQSVPTPHIISQRATLTPEPVAPVAKVEAAAPVEEPVQEAEPQVEEAPQRVIVESGMRRHGKASGLSFGRPREEQPQEAPKQQAKPVQPEPKQEQRHEPKHEHKQEHKSEHKHDRQNDQRDRSERHERAESISFAREDRQQQQQRQREQERPQQNQQRQREEPRREQERQARPAMQPARASEDTRKAEAAPGRLFGWLVSYSDPDGAATELREGKFFVTASSLKQTDLVLDEPSISTPHALVTVGLGGGLQVQDLMSDRGVFVRRRGDDTYRREADVVGVEHGDWLRFGDVEFLVSLIAHVGVK
ncbi:MAG: FHA domain-containing protein [Deltaproteobacteria bacterium]|nr:FHA domain-containing protein [Deltaproteobacteria bacterium]